MKKNPIWNNFLKQISEGLSTLSVDRWAAILILLSVIVVTYWLIIQASNVSTAYYQIQSENKEAINSNIKSISQHLVMSNKYGITNGDRSNKEISGIENFVNQTEDIKYARCDKYQLGTVMKDIFQKNKVLKNNQNWDVYLPCGYNYVESELRKVKPSNSNQKIFGISGCDRIVSKNFLWKLLVSRYGRGKAATLMPNTYLLEDPEEMKLFMKEYDPHKIYILKKNIQRKEGLKLTSNRMEILQALKDKYKVVQEYKKDVFLINKRKINLRIYLLIVCQNGKVQGYLNKIGKCIYTNKDYDPSKMGTDGKIDFESNITSYKLDLKIYQKNPLTLGQLREYLDNNGYDSSLLFNRINKIMSEVMQAVKGSLCQLDTLKSNKTFQLFGADVIFDKKMKPYLLEMNKGPDMIPKDQADQQIKNKVQDDIFAMMDIVPGQVEHNDFYPI